MMIDKARRKIDELDTKIAKLLEERMETVAIIADYKKRHRLAIVDLAREQEIICRLKKRFACSKYQRQLINFFEFLINITRDYQKNHFNNK